MNEGWVFDVYPVQERMILWIKGKNNAIIRLEDLDRHYSLYVAANDRSELFSIFEEEQITEAVESSEFVLRYERTSDIVKSTVLRLSLKEATKAPIVARQIESFGKKFGRFRLYNVDLLPAQYYFYEKDLFPLAFCYFDSKQLSSNIKLKDNICLTDYQVPYFKSIHLMFNLKKEGKIAKPADRISSILIQLANETIEIEKESDRDR